MSGIEALGIVLGVFPLIISAYEHYRGVHEKFGRLTSFKREHKQSIDDVEDEQLIFRLHLKKLLLPLLHHDVIDAHELEAFLASPGGRLWMQPNVDTALRSRLAEAYQRYMQVLGDLQKTVLSFLKSLGFDSASLQQQAPPLPSNSPLQAPATKQTMMARANEVFKDACKTSLSRIEFCFQRKEHEQYLQAIRLNNAKLEKFLQSSDEVAVLYTSPTTAVSPVSVTTLLKYWQHANRVYALIHQSFRCTCQKLHCAHLWLQHRTSPDFEFKILVLFAPRDCSSQRIRPWHQQGLQIQWLKPEAAQSFLLSKEPIRQALVPCKTQGSAQNVHFPTKSALRRKGHVANNTKPAVTWAATSKQGVETTLHADQTDVVKRPKPCTITSPDQVVKEIVDLCNLMAGCGMEASCLGSLSDATKSNRYSVHAQPDQKLTADEVTLKDVLQETYRPRLRRSERFSVALAIASSHLQLHSTKWARKQWQATDIRFPLLATDPPEILVRRPYVAADFNDATDDNTSPKQSDRSFASLGVMLLELLFGMCLEAHSGWKLLGFQQNQTIPLYRLMVARLWADEVLDEAGADYSAAVLWCLNESPTSLDGTQWRKDLADRVVLPLQNCCSWISSSIGQYQK